MKKLLVCIVLAAMLFVSTVCAGGGVSFENATVEELQKALSYGLISCEELTCYCLDRIEQYNNEYNCFITLFDNAIEQAKEKDELLKNGKAEGALFGVPVVVKDNMDIEGYPTTNGYSSGYIASENADVVQALIDEGAIIIGKTNMSAGAESARDSLSDIIGNTGNAYNSLLSPGGSSGGSAAAVSLNFAFIGLGTDTNSSLRIPAALNGCVALRSTFGLVSTEGIVPLNTTRDVAGAITDNVYDQALMADILTDFEYSYTENLNANALDGVRLGVIGNLAFDEDADIEVLDAFKNAIGELRESGAQVEMIEFPELEEYAESAFYWDSEYYREELYTVFEQILEENDLSALIYPSILSTPITLGTREDMNSQNWLNNTWMLSSTTGCPEITVPIGIHSEGSGIGMEISSLKNNEQLLLDIAYSYTNAYDHREIPIEDEGMTPLSRLIADYESASEIATEEQEPVFRDTEEYSSENKGLNLGILIAVATAVVILIITIKKKSR